MKYKIKINDIVISDNYISRGTYMCSPHKKEIAREWKDGNGKRHVRYYRSTSTEISLNIRKRDIKTHAEIANVFKKKTNVNVEYWNDIEQKYETGCFQMENLEFKQKKYNGIVYYDETTIRLIES